MSAPRVIMVADPDEAWSQKVCRLFAQNNFTTISCRTGKETQAQAYLKELEAVVIDADLHDHSSAEVLRYLRVNFPSARVILTARDQKQLSDLGFAPEALKRQGIEHTFIKPFEEKLLLDYIEGKNEFNQWKELIPMKPGKGGEEVLETDDAFLAFPITNFFHNGVTMMDYYLKLSEKRYAKIFHKGVTVNEEEIKRLELEKGVEYLYFKKTDNQGYINYLNDTISNLIQFPSKKGPNVATGLEEVVDKYVTQVHSSGLDRFLLDEGLKICQNLYDYIRNQSDLAASIAELEALGSLSHDIQFLTAFYSVIISKNLTWSSKRVVDFTCMGGMLHGIGKLKLPEELTQKDEKSLTPAEWLEYELYPSHGFNILSEVSAIPEPVKQIVYQHRELVNGDGFPNHFSFMQIYPLAKIVSVARELAVTQIDAKLSPAATVKQLIGSKAAITRYDGESLRAFIQAFTKKR